MNLSKRAILLVIFSVLNFSILIALDLTSLNLFYHYYPYNDVLVSYQINQTRDTLILDFKIQRNSNIEFEDLNIRLLSQPHYESKAHKEIQDLSRIISISLTPQTELFTAHIPKSYVDSLLIIEVYNLKNDFGFLYDIPLGGKENYPLPYLKFSTSGTPLLSDFVSTYDTLLMQESDQAFGYYYSYTFTPASPPMGTIRQQTQGEFKIDSSFLLQSSASVILKDPGLYLFQEDSSSFSGKPLRAQADGFPEYRTIPDLINCIKYITTAAEFKDLQRNPNKKNFDAKWLDMAGTANRAKSQIRRYYQRVEEANIFFTSYKEGWKTDQGMIYIIFGTPDEVKKGNNYQQWHYQKTPVREEATFNFIKVKDLFSRSHYRLIRNEEYAGVWFRTVERWRTGR